MASEFDRRTTGASDPRLSLVDALVDVGVVTLDVAGNVTSWNEGAHRLHQHETAAVLGRHLSVLYPEPARQAGTPDQHLALAAADGRFEEELSMVRADDSTFWADLVVTALRTADGRLGGFGLLLRDVSERRRGEEALRDSEERFRLLVDSVQDYAIFMLDRDGRVMTWNQGAQRLKGYRAEEIVGQPLARFYAEEDQRAGVPDRALAAARQEGRYESEGWRIRSDGSRFWANAVLTALRDRNGQLRGFGKVTRDLTDRKRSEDALRGVLELERQTTERLRELDRLRSDFVAIVAHDLRSPMNVVSGLAQLLVDAWDEYEDAERQHFLTRIARSTHSLLSLVEDVLEVAQIEAGQLTVEVEAFEMADVVRAVVADLGAPANAERVRLEVGDDVPPACGDVRRTWQVLCNLVSNALKFSPQDAAVDVTIDEVDRHVRVSVRDRGPGIGDDDREAVFDRFTRLSGTRDRAGSGLGLFIARSFVEAQQGTIWLEPAPGGGSLFRFTVPVADAPRVDG